MSSRTSSPLPTSAPDPSGPDPSAPHRPGRRGIARGAAWAVPIIAVGAAAPATAASSSCPSLPPFAEETGWTLETRGGGAGEALFSGGTFFANTDPHPSAPFTATASHSLDVVLGRTYEFSYAYTAYTGWSTPMSQQLLVDGMSVPGSGFDTNSSGESGIRSVLWVAWTTGTVTFSVQTSIAWDGNVYGDDITAYPVTVTCL